MNSLVIILSLFFFAIIAAYKERLGLLFILALLPSFLLRFTVFKVPTTWLELAIYILFLVWLTKRLLAKNLVMNLTGIYKNYKTLIFALLVWLAAAILATVISPDLRLSAGVLKGWWLDPIILIVLTLALFKDSKNTEQIIFSLLFGTSLVAVYGLVEYVFAFGMQADGLLNSVFKPANYVAMLITPMIVLGLGLLMAKRDKKRLKIQISFLIATCMVALFLTRSYGGLLGLASGIFTLLLFIPYPLVRRKALLTFIILSLVGLGLISTQDKFQRIITSNRSSLTTRLQIWEISTQVLKHNPWLGVGLGNFQQPYRVKAYEMYQPPLEWEVVKAHNLYLNTWLEMGLAGFLSFIYLIIIFAQNIKTNILKSWSDKKNWWLIAGSAGAMVSILVHGLLDTPYFKNDLSILFLVILSLPFILNKINTFDK